jgi:hypothetical protein
VNVRIRSAAAASSPPPHIPLIGLIGLIEWLGALPGTVNPGRIGADTPGARLTTWLRRFYAYFTSKRLVAAELLKHSDAEDPVFGAGYARVLGAGAPLLLAAQASGETRSALSLAQILDLLAAIAKIPGDAGYREPILQAALDSLRPIPDA